MKTLLIATFVLSLFTFVLPVYALDVDDIVYMAEENAPANFTEDGELKGISVKS